MYVYHRTKSIRTVQAIREGGFRSGADGLYGPGVYCTQDLASQLTPYMTRYGDYIVKSSLDTSKFLNFDDPKWKNKLAAAISYSDAKFLERNTPPSVGLKTLDNYLREARSILSIDERASSYSSVIAKAIRDTLPTRYFDSFHGIMYTGQNDGRTVLVFPYHVGLLKPETFVRSPFKAKEFKDTIAESFRQYGATLKQGMHSIHFKWEDEGVEGRFFPDNVTTLINVSIHKALHSNTLLQEMAKIHKLLDPILKNLQQKGYKVTLLKENADGDFYWTFAAVENPSTFTVGKEIPLGNVTATRRVASTPDLHSWLAPTGKFYPVVGNHSQFASQLGGVQSLMNDGWGRVTWYVNTVYFNSRKVPTTKQLRALKNAAIEAQKTEIIFDNDRTGTEHILWKEDDRRASLSRKLLAVFDSNSSPEVTNRGSYYEIKWKVPAYLVKTPENQYKHISKSKYDQKPFGEVVSSDPLIYNAKVKMFDGKTYISFIALYKKSPETPYTGSWGRLDSGSSFEVFSSLIQGLRQIFMDRPDMKHHLVFSAEEPSRQKLYQKLIQRFFPNTKVIQEGGSFEVLPPSTYRSRLN